jgi:hypothetical protein
VRADVMLLKLDHCGHVPHREQTEKTLAAATRFVNQVLPQ